MTTLETLDIETWKSTISEKTLNQAIQALENGKVLYFPSLPFTLQPNEKLFLSPEIVDPKTKNISYDIRTDRLGGTLCQGEEAVKLKEMLRRYAIASRQFLEQLLPYYTPNLIQAKTSFRPVEIWSRKSSYRKDDTLLHVDSFPSNPTKGQRILRLFTNINHEGKPRVWRLGEPFENVVRQWAPKASKPIWGAAFLLKLLNITKDYRSPYDHYMMQIHDRMKGDAHYQKSVPQEEVSFPTGCSWMVFTDQVSHAAMSGQHVLEQTFHLPAQALQNESTTPLRVLERFFNKSLL